MLRGPGGNEPQMIIQRVKDGMTFEKAVAEVEKIDAFECERWWIDLNREAILEAAGKSAPKKGK